LRNGGKVNADELADRIEDSFVEVFDVYRKKGGGETEDYKIHLAVLARVRDVAIEVLRRRAVASDQARKAELPVAESSLEEEATTLVHVLEEDRFRQLVARRRGSV
jgi:hypothetical protein